MAKQINKLAEDITLTHTPTSFKLLQESPDAFTLYHFYCYTASWQQSQSIKATTRFASKGLGWGKNRLYKAKKILKDFGIIQDVQRRDKEGKIQGNYILIRYINPQTSVPENHPVDFTTGGSQTPNAYIDNTNAFLKNINTNSYNNKLEDKEEKPNNPKPTINKQINNEEYNEWLKQKKTNNVKKQLKKKYKGSIPKWVDIDEQVEQDIANLPILDVENIEISPEYQEFCNEISKDRHAFHPPTPEDQTLFNRFLKDGWSVAQIKCACRIAYTVDDYWRKNFTPALFFRRRSAQSGESINNVDKFYNMRADSDPTIFRIKQECRVEIEDEQK